MICNIQFRIIWRYLNEPTLLMDGDSAGLNASSRALDLVLPELQGENSLNFIVNPPERFVRKINELKADKACD